MSTVRSYTDLIVWQRLMDLVDTLYREVANFPPAEQTGLGMQIKQVAISIPAYVASGSGRNNSRDFIYQAGEAIGGIAQLETLIIVAQRQGFIGEPNITALRTTINELTRMLHGLQASQRRRLHGGGGPRGPRRSEHLDQDSHSHEPVDAASGSDADDSQP